LPSTQYLKSLSLAAILAVSATFAGASTITYNLVNVNSSAGTLTGTVDIDSVTQLVTAANITLNDAGAGAPVFTTVTGTAAYNGIGHDHISAISNGPLNNGGHIMLFFDTSNLGLGNLSICLDHGTCGLNGSPGSTVQIDGVGGTPMYLTSGELDPLTGSALNPAPTAEPPSLLLLGTGILAGAMVLARFSGRKAETSAGL
jgi:hypothetical protein